MPYTQEELQNYQWYQDRKKQEKMNTTPILMKFNKTKLIMKQEIT